MKSQSDFAKGLLSKGRDDLEAARLLLNSGGPAAAVCFHAQQAVEKHLEVFLASHGRAFPFTHDIEELALLCEGLDSTIRLRTPEIVGLTEYAVHVRYDAEYRPTGDEARRALALAEEIGAAILSRLPPEFRGSTAT